MAANKSPTPVIRTKKILNILCAFLFLPTAIFSDTILESATGNPAVAIMRSAE